MAEGFTFSMVTTQFKEFMDDRQVRMRRAAMYTVREGGRVCKTAAKVRAPVLKDRSAVRVTAWKRGGSQWSNAPVAGLLRSSIASSRRLKETGDAWTLTVGPRGPRAILYAGKEEVLAHYMAAGYAAVQAAMPAIAKNAFGNVWKER